MCRQVFQTKWPFGRAIAFRASGIFSRQEVAAAKHFCVVNEFFKRAALRIEQVSAFSQWRRTYSSLQLSISKPNIMKPRLS